MEPGAHHLQGAAVYLFLANRPQPGRPARARDRPHLQDRPKPLRLPGPRVDPEIRHVCCWLVCCRSVHLYAIPCVCLEKPPPWHNRHNLGSAQCLAHKRILLLYVVLPTRLRTLAVLFHVCAAYCIDFCRGAHALLSSAPVRLSVGFSAMAVPLQCVLCLCVRFSLHCRWAILGV